MIIPFVALYFYQQHTGILIQRLEQLVANERLATITVRKEFDDRMTSIWKERDEAREKLKQCQAELEALKK